MTTALEGVRGQRHALAVLYPQERPGTHCTGGWVGRSGQVRKISPPPRFDPRTVQPVDRTTRVNYGNLRKLDKSVQIFWYVAFLFNDL